MEQRKQYIPPAPTAERKEQRKQYFPPPSGRKEYVPPGQKPKRKRNRRKLTAIQSARRKRLLLHTRRRKHSAQQGAQ